MFRTHTSEQAKQEGGEVTLAGFVETIREMGKIRFIILRDFTGRLQCVLKTPELLAVQVNKEDCVKITGRIVQSKQAPYGGIELVVSSMVVLNKVQRTLPVDPTSKVPAELETRLNYRFLDLRRDEIKKIFVTKSKAVRAFREYLQSNGFIDIQPPLIIGAASEGGAEVFGVQYFEKKAYLAQSPQLYKQMAVIGGIEKVAMTSTVFRAEKHNTVTHLNESTQMDAEAAFYDDEDAIKLLTGTLEYVTNRLASDYEEVVALKDVPVVDYDDAIKELRENNFDIEQGEDLSREAEKKLCEIYANGEAVVIKRWPTKIRAFYSMPFEDEPEYCRGYDMLYRGLEISSGAQRIHIPEILIEQLNKRGLNPDDFSFYLDAFYYGAPPHAGWSIGLERLTMKLLNLPNIREAMLFPRDRVRVTP